MEAVAKKADVLERYTLRTNKNGFEYKIANSDHPDVCPQSGIIIIEALKRSQIKQPRVTFTKVLDPQSGITYGIPLTINKDGDLIFKRIVLGEMVQFDMANPLDRQMWTVISHHECVKGSPFQRGIPLFKKVDKNAESNKIISSAKEMVRAVKIAQEMTGIELYDMAVNLGLSPEHNNEGILMSSVIEMATKKPEGFLTVYDNVNRNVITVFNRAKAVGLIKLDVANGYTWKDTHPLGTNDVLAIKTIMSNPTLLTTMDMESKQRSNYYKKNATKEQLEAISLNKDQYNNPSVKEDPGFLSDNVIKEKMSKLDAETERSKLLNDRLEKMLASQEDKEKAPKPDYSEYKKLTTEELQTMAFDLGFALAKTVTDRKVLTLEIVKRKK